MIKLVFFKANHSIWQVGRGDFAKCFFYTISYRLEPDGWGTKYPLLMGDFYDGKLENKYVPLLRKEVEEVREKLKAFSPDLVVYNFDDPSEPPIWGVDISDEITDLSNYFVTSDGRDTFDVLFRCIDRCIEYGYDIEIVSR